MVLLVQVLQGVRSNQSVQECLLDRADQAVLSNMVCLVEPSHSFQECPVIPVVREDLESFRTPRMTKNAYQALRGPRRVRVYQVVRCGVPYLDQAVQVGLAVLVDPVGHPVLKYGQRNKRISGLRRFFGSGTNPLLLKLLGSE